MFQVMKSRQAFKSGLALLVATLTVLTSGWQGLESGVARAAMPAVSSAASSQICAWPKGAIGKTRFGNTGVIDTAGTYLVMNFGRLPHLSLRIRGQFPAARYMSFTAYAGRTSTVIDHLIDQQIVPDRGSSNPFLPHARRHLLHRSYTIYVSQSLMPASGRATNTIYTAPYHPVLLMYRVYAPDLGANNFGDAPEPHIDILVGPVDHPTRILPMPTCHLTALRGAAAVFGAVITPLVWKRVGASDVGSNTDDAYLDMRIDKTGAEVYSFKFKAPTFAHTYRGGSITGNEDTRFWSFCQYDQKSGVVIACLHDYQAVRKNGYVTIVISTLPNRPASATLANGVNWLPFGRQQVGIVIYRQLLPNPAFPGNLKLAAPDAYPREMQRALGPYLPIVQTCSTAAFTPSNCSDFVDPSICSDLIEPAQCSPRGSIRRPTLVPPHQPAR